ncbi:alpha/beta fold hydrolase [Streptomyces diastatochromogenes]|nr:alpha/beta fold hydrolase [Streptomyces diastatochromogenes]
MPADPVLSPSSGITAHPTWACRPGPSSPPPPGSGSAGCRTTAPGTAVRPARRPRHRIAAADVARIADALGIDRFAVMGHPGAPHALACAAVLPSGCSAWSRVSGLAPFDAEGLDWFAGMAASCRASLTAAAAGREAKERYEAEALYDPEMFTPADHAALAGDWSWFEEVVEPAVAAGPGGLVDDDLAYVHAWGCDPGSVTAPVLVLHGGQDRIVPSTHGEWLANRCPRSELRLRPDDGHLSVLTDATAALEWLVRHAER